MRPRKLRLTATLGGMPIAFGEVKVQTFATMRKADTTNVCPSCGEKPKWKGGYTCDCGEEYHHHSRLRKVVTATREVIEKQRLIAPKEIPQAHIFVMKQEDFANKYADAISSEYGIVTNDPTTALNIRKLLIAVDQLGMVVVMRFNDTYEERVCLLTRNASNRVLLREIIPINLAVITETLLVDMSDVKESDIAEAQQLVKMIQEADEEIFYAHDYRVMGLPDEVVEVGKVLDIKEILAKIQG